MGSLVFTHVLNTRYAPGNSYILNITTASVAKFSNIFFKHPFQNSTSLGRGKGKAVILKLFFFHGNINLQVFNLTKYKKNTDNVK